MFFSLRIGFLFIFPVVYQTEYQKRNAKEKREEFSRHLYVRGPQICINFTGIIKNIIHDGCYAQNTHTAGVFVEYSGHGVSQ